MLSGIDALELPKSEADVVALVREGNASPYIGQLTREEIEHWLTVKTIRFFYRDATLVGFGAWDKIDADWCEIGPFYSLGAFRGQGLGTQIVGTLVTLNSSLNQYAVTKNPVARKLFTRFNFRQVGILALPWPIIRHLLGRVSFGRAVNLGRKFSLDPVTHYLKERRVSGQYSDADDI